MNRSIYANGSEKNNYKTVFREIFMMISSCLSKKKNRTAYPYVTIFVGGKPTGRTHFKLDHANYFSSNCSTAMYVDSIGVTRVVFQSPHTVYSTKRRHDDVQKADEKYTRPLSCVYDSNHITLLSWGGRRLQISSNTGRVFREHFSIFSSANASHRRMARVPYTQTSCVVFNILKTWKTNFIL